MLDCAVVLSVVANKSLTQAVTVTKPPICKCEVAVDRQLRPAFYTACRGHPAHHTARQLCNYCCWAYVLLLDLLSHRAQPPCLHFHFNFRLLCSHLQVETHPQTLAPSALWAHGLLEAALSAACLAALG
jgi:hypothetical protein